MRRRFPLAVLLGAVLTALLGASSAHACSCAAEPTVKRLKRADAAAEIKVLSVRHRDPVQLEGGGSRLRDSVLKVKLLSVHKGPQRLRRAETAKVMTGAVGNSCALHPKAGWRSGLFLRKQGRNWSAGSCDVVGRRDLRRAVRGNGDDQRVRPLACEKR